MAALPDGRASDTFTKQHVNRGSVGSPRVSKGKLRKPNREYDWLPSLTVGLLTRFPIMSVYDDRPLSLDEVSTYPLASRESKVTVKDFAQPIAKDSSLADYLASLPNILAVQGLRDLAQRIRVARESRKPIICRSMSVRCHGQR